MEWHLSPGITQHHVNVRGREVSVALYFSLSLSCAIFVDSYHGPKLVHISRISKPSPENKKPLEEVHKLFRDLTLGFTMIVFRGKH